MFETIKKLIFENLAKILRIKTAGSVFILIVFLCVSWFYLSDLQINTQEERQYQLLRSSFEDTLSKLIKEKHPEVKEFILNKVLLKKTEDLSQIGVDFNYTLKSEQGDSELEGSALLLVSEENVWQIQNFQIEKSHFDFAEPLLIKAGQIKTTENEVSEDETSEVESGEDDEASEDKTSKVQSGEDTVPSE